MWWSLCCLQRCFDDRLLVKTLTQAPLIHLQETLTEDVRRAGEGVGLVYTSPPKYILVFQHPSLLPLLQELKMKELIEKDEKELASLAGLCQRCAA